MGLVGARALEVGGKEVGKEPMAPHFMPIVHIRFKSWTGWSDPISQQCLIILFFSILILCTFKKTNLRESQTLSVSQDRKWDPDSFVECLKVSGPNLFSLVVLTLVCSGTYNRTK